MSRNKELFAHEFATKLLVRGGGEAAIDKHLCRRLLALESEEAGERLPDDRLAHHSGAEERERMFVAREDAATARVDHERRAVRRSAPTRAGAGAG